MAIRSNGESLANRVSIDRVEGPSGLQTSGVKCTPAQLATVYGKDTITSGNRFCKDFNDAIISGIPPVEAVPTESAFLHKQNGDRCNQQFSATSAMYLTNPASLFFINYLTWKLPELSQPVILDGLRPDWYGVMDACGGIPKEYADVVKYHDALAKLADSVFAANIKVGGVMGDAGSHWYRFQYLDPLVCEPCLAGFDGMTTTDLLYKATELDGWVRRGKDVYIVQKPDLGCVHVTWEKGLNLRETASMHNAGNIGFLYKDNKFHPLEIETNSEGTFAKYSNHGWVAVWLKSNNKTYAIESDCE